MLADFLVFRVLFCSQNDVLHRYTELLDNYPLLRALLAELLLLLAAAAAAGGNARMYSKLLYNSIIRGASTYQMSLLQQIIRWHTVLYSHHAYFFTTPRRFVGTDE